MAGMSVKSERSKSIYYGFICLLLAACGDSQLLNTRTGVESTLDQSLLNYGNLEKTAVSSREPLDVLPMIDTHDPSLVKLGDKLFHDTALSPDSIACAHCHRVEAGGVDHLPLSFGSKGQLTGRNSPTVWDSFFNFRQFWDGRADSLEQQVDGPIHASNEMASSWPFIIEYLQQDPQYTQDFNQAFPQWGDAISINNIRHAIATYEQSLTTYNSRFDQYLMGNTDAISAEELAGYETFKDLGCSACHQGRNVGGNTYQYFGLLMADRKNHKLGLDQGRFDVTGRDADRYLFKVPSLRHVTHTQPYFHDGSVPELEQAIRVMAEYQIGINISDEKVGLIIQFLKTLDTHTDGSVSQQAKENISAQAVREYYGVNLND